MEWSVFFGEVMVVCDGIGGELIKMPNEGGGFPAGKQNGAL
jgi:hypothetical protein